MLRNILFGAVALLVSGSLAFGGEGLGLKVETRLDIGVTEKATLVLEGFSSDKVVEYNGISLIPSLTVSMQFTEQWSATFQLSAVSGFDDDDPEVIDTDGEASFDSFRFGVLCGYTFKVNEQFSVTPVLGLSRRSWEIWGEDMWSIDGTFKSSLLVLDLGATMALRPNDKLSISGELMMGIPVSGRANSRGLLPVDYDADFEGGSLFAAGANVEYKVTDGIAVVGGLGYELTRADWDWGGVTGDGEDELERFSIRLGVVFNF